ncbi:S41 family peptidase [Chryseobacterium sp. JUb7]|uniref:S41 family peptidase n=1 Tax=Chryseobacterium sp. JUb7 TaxID=2940599 RepID=UPI002166E7C0|nr:S41 family peptidase [Chryseobacterium sp. JUb7]MCS3529344.1 hypothetical protein [Chryseobacterium sp. JUb7]
MSKLLFIPFLFLIPSVDAQTNLQLSPGDTIRYTPKSKNPAWISVSSDHANLALAVFKDGEKIKDQDDSRGIKSVERFYYSPEKNGKYEFKIWAKSYVEKSKNITIGIQESKNTSALDGKLSTDRYLQDLKIFRSIREQANSGLYVYRSRKEIDSIYQWAEKETQKAQHIFDFYKIIVKLTVFEGSCHNFTDLPNHASYYLTQKNEYLPITLKNLDGRLLQNSAGTPIPLSAEIISINNISSKEMILRFSQYYYSDGFSEGYKEANGFEKGMLDKFYIEFGTHKNYTVSYRWNDKIQQITLPGISLEKAKKLQEDRHSLILNKKLNAEKYALTKDGENLYRLSVRGFDFAVGKEDPAYKKFSDFLDQMMITLEKEKIENLMIDLRGNTGGAGALYEKVFTYLTERPFRDSQYAYTKFNKIPLKEKLVITPFLLSNGVKDGQGVDTYLKQIYPKSVQEKFYWADDKNVLILPNEKTFKGQLYLLIDENVASAGSHLASLIKSYTNAIVIGRETVGGYYEHNGHLPLVYELPNTGIQTGFSIVHVIQDAQILPDQKRGSGIIPHIPVQQTDKEFLESTDPYLKKVDEILKTQ